MGFRPQPTIYTLRFTDTFLDGLVVRVGCCTVAEFQEMLRWQATNGSEMADANERVTQRFLDHLKEWNLENPISVNIKREEITIVDGEEVTTEVMLSFNEGDITPYTLDGCNIHEQIVMREIIQQWQKAMAGVSDELGKDSMSGRDSLERSLGLGG